MTTRRPSVAILGGGMGGMAAAWRLSEPGWRDRLDRITVYQRGWRLGGKGASSRGRHGRIEEHGLHVWLGFYENAFRLLRECYGQLDRPTTDPTAPILTWRDAMHPAPAVGLEDRDGDDWRHWLARLAPNDLEPGDPRGHLPPATIADYAVRALRLVADFVESLADVGATAPTGRLVLSGSSDPPTSTLDTVAIGARLAVPAALLEATRLARLTVGGPRAAEPDGAPPVGAELDVGTELVDELDRIQDSIRGVVSADPDVRRSWQHVSLTIALVRGLVLDGVLTDARRLAALDDEDFLEWIRRHGAAPEVADGAFLRAMYDMVFAYDGGDVARPRFGAGSAVLLAVKLALEYKGAIFWKMRAGMGDVVFAPLYQALRQRGVDFEFFHRVDGLHLSADRTAIEAISMGRQARPAPGVERYEPLVRVRGLPGFPGAPLLDQLTDADGIEDQPLESHWCSWPDAERRVLRRGDDFDIAVLAIPVGMAGIVCRELVDDRREWRDMVANVATVATQAFQVWLREPDAALGWPHPGTTMSGYAEPFDTWASMPQLIDAEDWPDDDRPGTIAYFCGALAAPWPPAGNADDPAYRARLAEQVRERAVRFLDRDLGHLLPGAMNDRGFRWDLLCGRDGRTGPAAFDSQFWTANVDPSDRYVQSLPGTNRYRLRSDESGYDNLFLAGDWTDSGLNAGCIEAAVLSGLQAANAVLGRARNHRVVGYLLD
ncbi:MAG: FAD-dependent oxidoreductase [Acidimicrobiales bacterium]